MFKKNIFPSGFDEAMFYNRGGRYNWSKEASNLDW